MHLQIKKRKWTWIEHCLRRSLSSIDRLPLKWNHQESRRVGRLKSTWKRTILLPGDTAIYRAQNRLTWKTLVEALSFQVKQTKKYNRNLPLISSSSWQFPFRSLFPLFRRGIATDEYIQQMHQSSPRHALSDVISASQMVTTSQPMLGGMGVIGSIGGAGGGVSIGGAGGAELKPRFYDEVSEQTLQTQPQATIRAHLPNHNYFIRILI